MIPQNVKLRYYFIEQFAEFLAVNTLGPVPAVKNVHCHIINLFQINVWLGQWWPLPGNTLLKRRIYDIHGARCFDYRQTCNIRRTLAGNKIVDHSYVVGAVGAAPTTSSSCSRLNTWHQWIGQRQMQDETRNILAFFLFGAIYTRGLTVHLKQSSRNTDILWQLTSSRSFQ